MLIPLSPQQVSLLLHMALSLLLAAGSTAALNKRATDVSPPGVERATNMSPHRGSWLQRRRRFGAYDVRKRSGRSRRRHRQRHVPFEFDNSLSSQSNSASSANQSSISVSSAKSNDVSNMLSSLPSHNFQSNNHDVVDLNSNRFFDPSIKITIEVIHDKGHPNDLDIKNDLKVHNKGFAFEVENLSAEKRKRLQNILSSIDSPLDGSQRIHGSGLFSTPKGPGVIRHRKHKRRPHRKKGRGKRKRKKHRHVKDPLLSGLKDVTPSSSSLPFEDLILGSTGLGKPVDPSVDQCQQWIDCQDSFMISYLKRLADLPSCPCEYPITLRTHTSDKVFDEIHQRDFRWLDASSEKDRLEVYQRGATYCIRSRLDFSTGVLGSQHCCYDSDMLLLTRGSGAGTPDLVHPELSSELHFRLDVLPWIVCKGDWTRYHQARKPNNSRHCRDNPDSATLEKQRQMAKKF